MSNEAKTSYLRRVRERYQNSSRRGKGLILDEFCAVCGYHRKYAIRVLNRGRKTRPQKVGRKRHYGDDLVPFIRDLWFVMEQLNAKRMVQALPLWLKHYSVTRDGLPLSPKQREQLLQMSASTLERFLKRIRKVRGLSTTRVNHALKNQIPIEIMDYKITTPGAMQADTVVHANGNLNGQYAHTLTMVDIFSGWTENRAIWTKNAQQVVSQISDVERSIPFRLHWFASDCGSEFLNYSVLRHFETRRHPIKVTRGRPYQKNDQCYVEQRNWTHVRQLFHYDRISDQDLIPLMNEIYELWNTLHNYFFPSVKIVKKEIQGKKIKKTYDPPKTPAQRLLESKKLTLRQTQIVQNKAKRLNPFELKTELEKKLKQFHRNLRSVPRETKAA